MNTQHPQDSQSKSEHGSSALAYQTNKIPWWIHLMWASFAVAASVYLLKFALADFIAWWS